MRAWVSLNTQESLYICFYSSLVLADFLSRAANLGGIYTFGWGIWAETRIILVPLLYFLLTWTTFKMGSGSIIDSSWSHFIFVSPNQVWNSWATKWFHTSENFSILMHIGNFYSSYFGSLHWLRLQNGSEVESWFKPESFLLLSHQILLCMLDALIMQRATWKSRDLQSCHSGTTHWLKLH